MNIDNITSDSMSLTYNGKEMLIKVYEQEIERLNKKNEELNEIINIRECQLEEMQKQKTDYTQVNILEMKLDKLCSIIKEVREWVYKIQQDNKRLEPIISTDELDDILEILDKGEPK